jgi:hypothetical protein
MKIGDSPMMLRGRGSLAPLYSNANSLVNVQVVQFLISCLAARQTPSVGDMRGGEAGAAFELFVSASFLHMRRQCDADSILDLILAM